MIAARFVATGRPPEVREVDRPGVTAPRDVLVRVAAAGICRTDLHVLDGVSPLQPPPAPPFTLGHETSGWVEEVGPQVTRVRPGDPVLLHPAIACGTCVPCRSGQDMYCAALRFPGLDGSDGGYAEYVRTSESACVPLSRSSDLISAAPLADAGLTAYHAVRRIAGVVGPGSVILVVGVGGLGHLGVQCVRQLTGARLLAVDPSPERLDAAVQFGAEPIQGSTTADRASAVDRATRGQGVDVVLDFVGEGDTPEFGVRCLRRGGTYSVVGYGGALEVPTVAMVTRELRLQGNFVGTYSDLVELVALYERGRIDVRTDRAKLREAPTAVQALRDGRPLGRIVLVP